MHGAGGSQFFFNYIAARFGVRICFQLRQRDLRILALNQGLEPSVGVLDALSSDVFESTGGAQGERGNDGADSFHFGCPRPFSCGVP